MTDRPTASSAPAWRRFEVMHPAETADQARSGSSLPTGIGLVWVTSAVIAASAAALTDGHVLVWVYGCAAVAAATAGLCRLLPERWFTGFRLVLFSLIGLAELAVVGAATRGVGPAYAPLIVLVFIYLGLACPPGTSWLLIVPAAATWLLINDVTEVGLTAAMLVRLPISITVWLLVGELLARRTRRLQSQADLLASQVKTDSLTGLDNRRALPDLLAAARPGDALVMLDLDHFAHVNETRGHVGGDQVLAEFGTAVRHTLRGQDRALRYGGEEVLLLLPDAQHHRDADEAQAAVDVALTRLADSWRQREADVTFSAGGVILAIDQPATAAIQAADRLLYQAKQAGRDRWRLDSANPAVPNLD